jgi:hypothetical protein
MQFNIIYNNNGPRTPSGSTSTQAVASLNSVGAYLVPVQYTAQLAPIGNSDAASVIQSNGENIGNARLKSNPLPPGLTS